MLIRNDAGYQRALERRRLQQEVAARQRQAFVIAGFEPDDVARGMEPLLSFQAKLAEDIERYEDTRGKRKLSD